MDWINISQNTSDGFTLNPPQSPDSVFGAGKTARDVPEKQAAWITQKKKESAHALVALAEILIVPF